MDIRTVPANDLARLCSDAGSVGAWTELVRRFQRPIALAVLRTSRMWGVTPAAVLDDLVQETFLRLCAEECKLLREFVGREPDSIAGYLKVIAANVTHDHFRAEKSQKRGGGLWRVSSDDGEMDLLPAPETRSAERAVQMNEMDRCLESLVPGTITERDRTIFWLYFLEGFSARDIGEMARFGLSVKGVESSLHRTTGHLRERMMAPARVAVEVKGFSSGPTMLRKNG